MNQSILPPASSHQPAKSLKLFYVGVKQVFLLLISASFCIHLSANTYNVNTTADGHAAVAAPGSGTTNLRGAIEAADALGGTHVINVPAGTYTITLGEITFGNIAQNLTISGAGPGATILSMTTGGSQDRFMLINPPGTNANIQTTITGMGFTNGRLRSDVYGGGAIVAGGPNNALSLTNCAFTNNSIDPALTKITGGAICFIGGGSLSINQCSFTNNTSPATTSGSSASGYGGAIYFGAASYNINGAYTYPNNSLSVTNSTFTGNTAASYPGQSGQGGAIAISAGGYSTANPPYPTLSVTVRENVFVNNSATGAGGQGGAIAATNSFSTTNTFLINYNRFYGNTAGSGQGSALISFDTQGNVDATNNWWGCNGGPSTCADKTYRYPGGSSGTLTVTPYLQLRTTAASTLCTGSGTTVTTGFTINSANNAVGATNLSAFDGLPISWTSSLGTLSNLQITIQAGQGTATATYTGTTAGTGTVNATTDAVPSNDATARASITVNASPAITDQPDNTTVCAGASASFSVAATGGGTLSYQWYKGVSSIIGATGPTYTINNATASDAASNYNVRVSSTNGCPQAQSGNASLAVNALPTASTPTGNTNDCTGSTINLTTTAGGSGTLSYQWYKGATPLTAGATGSGSSISNVTSATLTISNASVADNATNYNVKVASSTGCATATSANATVAVAPPTTPAATSSGSKSISATNTIITSSTCDIITTIVPSGSSPVNGPVTASVTVQNSVQVSINGSPYAPRYYDINPTNNASTATATVTLYFTQADFTAYNAHPNHGLNLPTDATDAPNYKANIRVFVYHGSSPAFGTTEEINPTDNSIVWNSTYNRWQVTFGVTGFSRFYLASAGNQILPLQLISFSGYTDGNNAWLQWKTTDEKNLSHFEIERSTDAVNFSKTGQVASGNKSYSFTDHPAAKTLYYYRLKIVDKDGRYNYTYLVAINLKKAILTLQVMPNPFTDKVMLNLQSLQAPPTVLRLTDMKGKVLVQKTIMLQPGANAITLPDLGLLAKGSYLLQVVNNEQTETVKLVKAE